MNFNAKKVLMVAAVFLLAGRVAAQEVKVDYTKYPDAKPYATGVTKSSLASAKAVAASARSTKYGDTRPDHVNNALTKFYPPVFNQSGGSCGSAQAVGYCMTYDMNAYRNTDASYPENQLPTHFTWLHTYAGIDKYDIMNKHGVPNVVDYGGRTYSETFGVQDTKDINYGYMQGYDKWYRAMFNRTLGGDTFCDGNQMTEIGREQLKQWLWNHWGDESFYAGGVSGIGVASGGNWGRIPTTVKNRELGVAGLFCVSSWGQTYDHALTIVGYDDRIEFDLDSNGVFGEPGKDEMGAWIICNSWGDGWCNKGFIYCPYKFSYAIGTNTLPLNSGHYTWRKDYEPKRVFKILMDYDHRSEISLSAGIAADTTATKPESKEVMPFFKYTGDGTKATPAPEVPMLGKWRTKKHTEPMEFGYDVTDLTSSHDFSKPLKYFFIIESKTTAIGAGHIYKLSLMDYEIEKEGMELPARIDTVAILNGGKTTIVSLTVPGRQVYEPLNASLSGNRLTWNAPKPSSFKISRYYIYKGSEKIAEVPEISTSYTVDDPTSTYYVATAYSYKDQVMVSAKSSPARNSVVMQPSETNQVLSLSNAAITVPDIMKERLNQATIEFWMKPKSVANNSQQIGSQWGEFLFSVSATGQICCGWDTSNRVLTSANTIKVGNWYHVAIVVDANVLTVYVNGLKKGTYTSSTYSGIPAMSAFHIGNSAGRIDADLDEFRIWTATRPLKAIFGNKGLEVACPSAQTDLLVYYPMITYNAYGNLYIKDMASGHDAIVENATVTEDSQILSGTSMSQDASFDFPSVIYAGEPVMFKSASAVNTVSWAWSADGTTSATSNVVNPYFTFKQAGTYDVTLEVTDTKGASATKTTAITVINPESPKADFEIAADTLGEGEMFCLANKSTGANCIYKWLTPGADCEEMNSVNAGITYSHNGVYPITLVVSNAGGTDEMTKYVTVSHAAPAVAFCVDPAFIELGETTYLIDESRHTPETWKWTLDNGKHQIEINGQNSSYTPSHPGVYNVTLEVSNEMGTSTQTEPGKLVVVNADSRNALNFTGAESAVTTSSPFANGTKALTLEWWMNPTKAEGALSFSTATGQFSSSTNEDGAMTVSIGGKSVTSDEGYVISGEWHHYAISYSVGMIKFYRDAELISSPSTRLALSTTAWGNLTVSGAENPFQGQVDELRIWGKSLSLANMKNYINAPLTDIENLVSSAGLVAYYDFNQNGGNVIDRTSNGINLERVGFGPDGDAWGLSRGVFSLDLDPESPTEVLEADGMTHIYESVAAGKTGKFAGLNGVIRIVLQEKETVRIYTADGQCVLNDDVEGVHYIPFEPGVYIVNGEKVMVK